MTERFERFFTRLMGYEGGYANDPKDKGGETKYGISKKSYPDIDIKNLTVEGAKFIYYKDYYKPLHVDSIMDEHTAWQVFDFGVNAGVSRAAKMLQKVVKASQDGIIGENTLFRANTWEGKYPLHIHFKCERIRYYFSITDKNPSQYKFLKGWLFRAYELPLDI